MKILQKKRFLYFLLVFFLCLGMMLAAAQGTDREKILKGTKFQIELYGGYSKLNPADFNMMLDYDRQIQHFFYDDYYDFLLENNQISSWSNESDTNRKKITKSFPFGLKLKYFLNKTIAISLGFKYLSKNQNSDCVSQYRRTEIFGDQFIDRTEYSPYTLSVKGYTPMLGIHFLKKIRGFGGIEAYIMGGPLFVECMYVSGWNSDWLYQGDGYTYLMYQTGGRLEEKGKGTGYALDFGGRINIPLLHPLGLFMELGYAFQAANRISGPGREIRDGTSETWDNQWGIKEEHIQTEWGTILLQRPTNYREGWSEDQQVRDFKLDLSGFQLRFGIFVKF